MRLYRLIRVAALMFLTSLALLPASAEPAYQTGTLLGIEKKVKITPLTYVYEAVASYYETITHELEIAVGDTIYYTDYTPDLQPDWPLPEEWRPGNPLNVRMDKHRIFIKLSHDGEITTYIAHRKHVKAP
jgi:hypothetical protein